MTNVLVKLSNINIEKMIRKSLEQICIMNSGSKIYSGRLNALKYNYITTLKWQTLQIYEGILE